MTDDNDRADKAAATPNRGNRRQPATIEAEALAPEQGAPEHKPAPAEPPAPPPQPARAIQPGLVALPGLAALLLAGVALYLALTGVNQSPVAETLAGLGQRLNTLETRLAALESKPAPSAPDLAPQLAPLAARIAAVESKTATPLAPPKIDLAPLEKRLQALETRPVPVFDPVPLERRIARLEADLSAPKTDIRATQAPDIALASAPEAAAVALVAESLRQKLDRGAALGRELTALETLGVAPAKLASLKPFASTGAPTAAQLALDFSTHSSAMLRAARPATEDGDFLARLSRSAASLVRVRPVGDTSDDSPPALLSRIEAALGRGDVEGALALFERLPPPVSEPARGWAAQAQKRASADAAARALQDELVDRLARK